MNETILCLTGLRAGYGRQVILREVSLAVDRGEWLALLGPNGAGKTTLLSCIAGIHPVLGGEITVCGQPLTAQVNTANAAKQLLGFACPPESIPGLLTGLECLQIFAAAKGLDTIGEEVWALGEALEMSHRLPLLVDQYSQGMRQKLAVLLALVGEPQLILLDESFNGLDPASALVLKKHLAQRVEARRCALVLATHALDLVERYASRAVLLLDGAVRREWQAGEIRALRQTEGGFEAAVAARGAAADGR